MPERAAAANKKSADRHIGATFAVLHGEMLNLFAVPWETSVR